VYLRPYRLNRIENAFSKLKVGLRKHRSELDDFLWKASGALIPTFAPPPGANFFKAADIHLYVADHGCKWHGLPKHLGNWHTIYTGMSRWARSC
jgi:transposase